jgi:hypothetical protein
VAGGLHGEGRGAAPGGAYTASDGSIGTPYILASGAGLRSFPLSLSPVSATAPAGGTHTVTARLLDGETSEPVAGTPISFRVMSGAYLDRNDNGAPDPGEPQTAGLKGRTARQDQARHCRRRRQRCRLRRHDHGVPPRAAAVEPDVPRPVRRVDRRADRPPGHTRSADPTHAPATGVPHDPGQGPAGAHHGGGAQYLAGSDAYDRHELCGAGETYLNGVVGSGAWPGTWTGAVVRCGRAAGR